jgi:hypothetical protein
MRLFEFKNLDSQKLLALSQFLLGRSEDTSSKKEISQDAFIELANSLGVRVNANTLGELLAQEPLSNIMEPLELNSNVIRFKGNTEAETNMTVDQARAVVDSNAKSAMKRRQ